MIKRLAISTGPLRTSLPVHARPIDLLVLQGPSVIAEAMATRPYLEGGFSLRCFQRFSFPSLATLRCR